MTPYNMTTLGTHRAFLVAVHGEVGAKEQVSNSQEQRLGQRSSSIVVVIQLICLECFIIRLL